MNLIIAKDPKPELSIPTLELNLYYAEIRKLQASNAHREALLEYHHVLDALDQAIRKKNS